MSEMPLHQLPPFKELHRDLRSEAARETLQARAEFREASLPIHSSKAAISEASNDIDALLERKGHLQLEFEELARRSLLRKIVSRFKVGESSTADLQSELGELYKDIDLKRGERDLATHQLEAAEAAMQGVSSQQEVLHFYKEKLTMEQLTNAEKRELLTPDFLASLSTEQFIELWRKLTPFFVSHITRHGVRQDTGSFHSGGVGRYGFGAKGMLSDGSLLSKHAMNGLRPDEPEGIDAYLEQEGIFKATDAKTAIEIFENELNHQVSAAERYPDESSVHFATGKILDRMYGGEQDNQVFAIFPADVIASQYNFSFNDESKNTFDAHDRDEWNDLFVYPNGIQKQGIPLNSGIVFLPKSTIVDKETGSQYQVAERTYDNGYVSDTDVMPVINTEMVASFREKFELLNASETDETPDDDNEAKFLSFLQSIGMEQRFAQALSKKAYIFFGNNRKVDTTSLEEEIENILYADPYFWRKAEDTISAEEYWENYFTKHPEYHPKHVVYYDGAPNDAMKKFLDENGIASAESPDVNEPYLGYEDHNVADTKNDKRAYPGYEEIVDVAKTAIKNHYSIAEFERAAYK